MATATQQSPTDAISPWRFLSPLSADDDTDRELLDKTRAKELHVVRSMVTSSRVSVLYAFSGNGKTSLIEAGLIPSFVEEGFAVFRTRPRPPYCTEDPVEAFKQAVLLDLSKPLNRGAIFARLDALLERASQGKASQSDALALLSDIKQWLKESDARGGDTTIRSVPLISTKGSLKEFLHDVAKLVGKDTRLLIICDQFEELFVHFGEDARGDEFITQIGEVWADSTLDVRLVFSMREEWVGSLIALRRVIPDIFRDSFRLSPLTPDAARDVLTAPLRRLGLSFKDDAIERVLDDLVAAYSRTRAALYGPVRLQRNIGAHRFIETPALQVVADALWHTRRGFEPPFTLAHYQSLRSADPTVANAGATDSTSPRSPAECVLDGYLFDALDNSAKSDGAEAGLRQLRIDCLYLLTDRDRHRRALTLERLSRELRRVRPEELELGGAEPAAIGRALQPLVERRILRTHESTEGAPEYELAHDFAVRAVVVAWKEQDRARVMRIAELRRERKSKDVRLDQLEREHVRWTRMSVLLPMASLVLTMLYPLLALGGVLNSSIVEQWVLGTAMVIGALWAGVGLLGGLQRQWRAVALAIVGCVVIAIGWRRVYWWSVVQHDYDGSYEYFVHARIQAMLVAWLCIAGMTLSALLVYSWAGLRRGVTKSSRLLEFVVPWFAELTDLALGIGTIIVIPKTIAEYCYSVSYAEYGHSSSYNELALGIGIAAFFIVTIVQTVLTLRTRASIGLRLAGLRLTADAPVGRGRLLVRQVALTLWTALNMYAGLPWLLVTPSALRLSGGRTVPELLAKLRTERSDAPAEQRRSSAAPAAA